MGNYTFSVRAKRWGKFLLNYVSERMRGLDFSMVYVGDIQRTVEEYHGYSMTDANDMKRMLLSVPVDPSTMAFLDVGCGKGMCMKCAVESGYARVAGLDLDPKLLRIAKRNMERLHMDAECIYANATEFAGYADYDVFYFYNPFGRSVFKQTIQKILDSQKERNRDIWVLYYHPVFSDLFHEAGFFMKNEVKDTTRDTTTQVFYYPAR